MSKTNKKDPVRRQTNHAVSNHIITHLYYYYTNTNYSDQTEMKRRKKETYYSSLLNLLFLIAHTLDTSKEKLFCYLIQTASYLHLFLFWKMIKKFKKESNLTLLF